MFHTKCGTLSVCIIVIVIIVALIAIILIIAMVGESSDDTYQETMTEMILGKRLAKSWSVSWRPQLVTREHVRDAKGEKIV